MKKLLLLAVLATSAHAQSITLCANKTNGNLFFRSRCFSSERAITNLSALKGATGATGPAGTPGTDLAKCHSLHKDAYYDSAVDPQDPTQTFSMFDLEFNCPTGEFLLSHQGYSLGRAGDAYPTLRYPNDDKAKGPIGVLYVATTYDATKGDVGLSFGMIASAVCCPF
jgi:hypothetical protein